ncbi:cyclin-dependent kinase 2-interacting protein-like [Acropora millepora]|uniref:cyclin-dependent kinase 2-interacting protein-like n=1 Tax=Acropora millepora TaxID=45264 RepID=UPI001CF312EE|nr:cyclin-dependent kinase 2-interacting protein-like [Acropora millepora]
MASPSPRKSRSPKVLKTPPKNDGTANSISPKSSPSKNLSDVARRVRECCASWHENVNKWSKLNELGTSVANKLVNLQLQKQYTVGNENTLTVEVEQDMTFQLQEEISESSEELSKIYISLADVLKRMEALVQNFIAIKKLVALKTNDREVIFSTWTIEQFCDTCQTLFHSFNNELSLKEKLMPEFKHCKNRDQLMVYLSLWLHEPLLDDDYEVLLESMLLEAELR